MTIQVLLVDDQPLLRTGFRYILDSEDDIAVVGEAADGEVALTQVAALRPDVVLMDVRMPRLDGVSATARITAEADAPRVIILTTYDSDEYVFEALRAGASGFLLKDVPADSLIEAVRIVHRGDAVVAPNVTRTLIQQFVNLPRTTESPSDAAVESLTGRERDVLLLIGQGLSNTEIARHLVLSETTVKTHVSNVLAKLGVRDRVQAVVHAYQSGLIRVDLP